jgi:hypothetical protein
MDAAVAGLIGAAIGAVAGVLGAIITHYLQSSQDNKKWVRDKREEAYSNTIRFLLRVLNKRSMITATGLTVLGQENIKEWFDDISEAQSWMTSLTIYCSESEKNTIGKLSSEINNAVSALVGTDSTQAHNPDISYNLLDSITKAYNQLLSSARRDIGRKIR